MPAHVLPDLPLLTETYDRAYQACARSAPGLPLRQQSDELLSAVARFCRVQVEAGRVGAEWGEDTLVRVLADAAGDPHRLTALLARINAEAGADDHFPASRFDPRNRRGWACGAAPTLPRIVQAPSWLAPTDAVLAELRRDTEGLTGQRLCEQFIGNLQLAAGPAYLAPEHAADAAGGEAAAEADACAPQMMPVTLFAYYALCFEQRIRDLETQLQGGEANAEQR
jgi:hypothetical protein